MSGLLRTEKVVPSRAVEFSPVVGIYFHIAYKA
jgi:hypothetical protein